MSKSNPTAFRLTPKLLVRAVLIVCVAAVLALAAGVVGTLKTKDAEPAVETQGNAAQENHIEVLSPNGGQGEIVLNPNALDRTQNQESESRAERNADHGSQTTRAAFVSPPERRETARQRPPAAHSERHTEPAATPTEPAAPKPRDSVAERKPKPAAESKTEQRSVKTKEETKPAPQPKQHKEVIDNLF